jgi:predicted nucleotidyltransferase
MKTLQEIELTLGKHKKHLFSEYPIKSLAIFGSYARKEQNEESDLDILVEFNDKIGVRFIDLAEELEKLIGFKVDLVSRNGIKDKYFQRIQSELTYV